MSALVRSEERRQRFRPERVLAFSDGVFAIAITLLILPLTELEFETEDVGRQLFDAVPEILTFVLGFAVIGIYWSSHHAWFSRVVSVDYWLLRINLVALLCVAFLPFPTSVLSAQGGTAGTIFYAGAVTLTGASFVAMWTYLVWHPDLLQADSAAAVKRHALIGLVTPLIFALSIPVALVSSTWGQLFWILVWPASIIAGRLVDRGGRSAT